MTGDAREVRMEKALRTIIAKLAPGPRGTFHRLDAKFFSQIYDIYNEALAAPASVSSEPSAQFKTGNWKRNASDIIRNWRESGQSNDDAALASAIHYWVMTEILPEFARQGTTQPPTFRSEREIYEEGRRDGEQRYSERLERASLVIRDWEVRYNYLIELVADWLATQRPQPFIIAAAPTTQPDRLTWESTHCPHCGVSMANLPKDESAAKHLTGSCKPAQPDLRELLKKSVTWFKILAGRMRSCEEGKGQSHELSLFEIEGWNEEITAALAAGGEAKDLQKSKGGDQP